MDKENEKLLNDFLYNHESIDKGQAFRLVMLLLLDIKNLLIKKEAKNGMADSN